jgi:CRISPR-associated protein Cas2
MPRTLYLAAYDIRSPRRLRRALAAIRAFATGGQKSLFECRLSDSERDELLTELTSILDPGEDCFFLTRLDPRASVVPLGTAPLPKDFAFVYQG